MPVCVLNSLLRLLLLRLLETRSQLRGLLMMRRFWLLSNEFAMLNKG